MSSTLLRITPLFAAAALLLILFAGSQRIATASTSSIEYTIPPDAPELVNDDFECSDMYYEVPGPGGKPNRIPSGWTQDLRNGTPRLNSALLQFAKECDSDLEVEKQSGRDSFVVRSWNIETPPNPGEPFDITLYQQTTVFSESAYSLSGWFVTYCGGSAVPNDCPDDVYMAKLIGLDPTGGVDPEADTVVWTENRDNFVDENDEKIGWSQLSTMAVSEATTMTVFARINSPFFWHGNNGYIDAFSLIRSPLAEFVDFPSEAISNTVEIAWDGEQSPDVETIAGGNYKLFFDVDYWHDSNQAWTPIVSKARGAGHVEFTANCPGTSYEFRVRAHAEQPDEEEGSRPNQRYPGPWSDMGTLLFPGEPGGDPLPPLPQPAYIPMVITEPGQC